MSDESVTRDLFDRWELVWHEDQYDLVPSCVGPTYIRHEATRDRVVTADSYAAELKKMKAQRPGIRVAVYDHMFVGTRAWFRFTFRWRDQNTGEPVTQAGMQSYRIEGGKLAETWIVLRPLGSSWPDAVAQKRWTSPPISTEAMPQILSEDAALCDANQKRAPNAGAAMDSYCPLL